MLSQDSMQSCGKTESTLLLPWELKGQAAARCCKSSALINWSSASVMRNFGSFLIWSIQLCHNFPRSGCLDKFTPRSDHVAFTETPHVSQALQTSFNMFNVKVDGSRIWKIFYSLKSFWQHGSQSYIWRRNVSGIIPSKPTSQAYNRMAEKEKEVIGMAHSTSRLQSSSDAVMRPWERCS